MVKRCNQWYNTVELELWRMVKVYKYKTNPWRHWSFINTKVLEGIKHLRASQCKWNCLGIKDLSFRRSQCNYWTSFFYSWSQHWRLKVSGSGFFLESIEATIEAFGVSVGLSMQTKQWTPFFFMCIVMWDWSKQWRLLISVLVYRCKPLDTIYYHVHSVEPNIEDLKLNIGHLSFLP